MKQIRIFTIGVLLATAMALAACGGGGGGGAGNGGGGGGGGGTVTGTTFNLVELAGLGGDFSAGLAINLGGLAVGFAHDGTSVKGAQWTVTDDVPAAIELSPLAGNSYSAAYGVNGPGIAVGESGVTVDAVADANTVAVYWPAGATTPLALNATGLLAGGASAALAVNENGEIVGEAVNDAAGNTAAVYWASPTSLPVILGNLTAGGFSSAHFIGADRSIVGEAQNAAGQPQAVIWLPAGASGFQAPIALDGVTNQAGSVAFGGDANGRIVGQAELTSGDIQGVIWNANGTVATSLGANTSAQATNDVDRIVGYNGALTGSDRAAIWNGADLTDNKTLAVDFSHAYGLNDSNQVVGFAGSQAFAAIPQ